MINSMENLMHTDVMAYRVLESFNYDTLQLLFFSYVEAQLMYCLKT